MSAFAVGTLIAAGAVALGAIVGVVLIRVVRRNGW
jgi:hypothetical protein